MAMFLNTQGLNSWIPKLIREAKREIVIIVPYIKTSENVYKELFNANQRGIETTIVYREKRLTDNEKAKFDSLDNLNLMHHPNVHAKCYYNGDLLIIGSMNLYEYSELNNREMGVLFKKEDDFSETAFDDAIAEINIILNASQIEKKSRETIEEGFIIDILKTKKELIEEQCKQLNKLFVHKKFEPVERDGDWIPVCKNYYDKIDLIFNGRVELDLRFEEKRKIDVYDKLTAKEKDLTYSFKGYKVYWNKHEQPIYIYKNRFKNTIWDNASHEQEIELLRQGVDNVISYLRKLF